MKQIKLLRFIFFFIVIGNAFQSNSQNDTINMNYFLTLKKDLLNDTSIIDVRYVREVFNDNTTKTQHIYVKYKTDTISGYWRVGMCYHYYPSGKLELVSNVDITTKKYDGMTVSLDQNGDTLEATIWENYKNRIMPPDVIYRIDSIGEVHELHPDKITEIKYKKGKRKSAETSIYLGNNTMTNLKEVYYDENGSITKVKDYSEDVLQLEKKYKE